MTFSMNPHAAGRLYEVIYICNIGEVYGFSLPHHLRFDANDHAGARRAMIATRRLHVVDVKTREPIPQRFQVHRVTNEAEIFLDLRMSGIVPVADR